MLHSAPSDRVKVAVSLCAIISSALTLAAYFGALDSFAARSMNSAKGGPGIVFDATTMSDTTLFPPGLSEFMGRTPASS